MLNIQEIQNSFHSQFLTWYQSFKALGNFLSVYFRFAFFHLSPCNPVAVISSPSNPAVSLRSRHLGNHSRSLSLCSRHLTTAGQTTTQAVTVLAKSPPPGPSRSLCLFLLSAVRGIFSIVIFFFFTQKP